MFTCVSTLIPGVTYNGFISALIMILVRVILVSASYDSTFVTLQSPPLYTIWECAFVSQNKVRTILGTEQVKILNMESPKRCAEAINRTQLVKDISVVCHLHIRWVKMNETIFSFRIVFHTASQN